MEEKEQFNYLGKDTVVPVSADTECLSGMYRTWYLDYASYVILERAVPHIEDGLKPVQRRILHSMQTLDDGRFNKVANIVGNTMQYHPHGDASIGDAIVQLGQKELLIDTQGNWGNILTGDSAAAPRYIEARLSPFALETLYSPKITEWTKSYDGRKDEPVTLPAKFPLVLAQGVEGIAVGLSSKILPHNFNEILDGAIAYLNGEEFTLLPDFQTGGFMDASRYNDGARGGAVKVRAKIEKIDNKTLAITELPYSKTTGTITASIISAMEKGKLKVRKIEDHTAAEAKIIVHLMPGTSSDKAIDALYAFTDCEVSISPNCCVIKDKKPCFMSVGELLKYSVDHTRKILYKELEIKLAERREEQCFASLEKIFISERMYKDPRIEASAEMEKVVGILHELFTPWKEQFYRQITDDDMLKLWEIRMKRILRFNVEKADEKIASLDAEIAKIEHDMAHIVEYTIAWYRHLKETYGAMYPRHTVIRSFENIEAAKVAEANKRLYYDKSGGFLGTALKDADFKCTCSDIDDILIINKDGTYKIVKTPEKLFVGKKVIHVATFKKGDKRTIYNVVYRNGKGGFTYKKRFFITGLAREKEYNITKGLPGSVILYLSANPNGEAEIVKVNLKQPKDALPVFKTDRRSRIKNTELTVNFADLDIKGKESLGNLVTKYEVDEVKFSHGLGSTLGGREVWFDQDVLRINYDGRGVSLGTFQGNDLVLVVMESGEYYTTTYSDTNHFDEGIKLIRRFDADTIWTLALFDPELGYSYLKRFRFEPSARKQRFVGNSEKAGDLLLTPTPAPILKVEFGGNDEFRDAIEIDAEEFIGVKSFKAKGKRISTFEVKTVTEVGSKEVPEEAMPTTYENNDEDGSDEENLSEENLSGSNLNEGNPNEAGLNNHDNTSITEEPTEEALPKPTTQQAIQQSLFDDEDLEPLS
jgi:topoisomerase-4 subunit A